MKIIPKLSSNTLLICSTELYFYFRHTKSLRQMSSSMMFISGSENTVHRLVQTYRRHRQNTSTIQALYNTVHYNIFGYITVQWASETPFHI